MSKKKAPLPKLVSAATARRQFGEIMRRAREEEERFVVVRRGEPQVVIMGIQDFLKTIAPEPEIMAAIRAASKKKRTNQLTVREIDQEIAAYRREQRNKDARDKSRT